MISRLFKLSISIIFYIINGIVISLIRPFKKEFPATLVIITYHSVKIDERGKFEKQMDVLLKVGHPVPINLTLPASKNKNFIGVTFDDGYQSVLENALAISVKGF